MTEARRAGVLGHPIGHSLSPVLHRAAYDALGLDWRYDAYDVEAAGLAAFLSTLDDSWVGLSLTMPLKVEAVRHMDFVEPLAKSLGAVNTVLRQPTAAGGPLTGVNTDVPGIVAAFREAGLESADRAVILGGGATATAAVAAIAALGCAAPVVAVRERARAGGLLRAASKLGVEPRLIDIADAPQALARAEAVVSTIPASAGEALASLVEPTDRTAFLLDAVYDPLVTPLGAAWVSAGGTAIGGVRMLLHQAAEQVRLMTGQVAPIAAMNAALVSQLSH